VKRRAFTLLDTLLSLGLFSLLTLVLFSVFAQGTSLFTLGVNRSDLHSELRAINALMSREVNHSSFYSLAIHNVGTTIFTPRRLDYPNQLESVHRDAFSCAALRNPLEETSYVAATGAPLWDCHCVYFSSQESPYGKLMRFRVGQAADERQFPLASFPGIINTYTSAALPGTFRVLSQRLMEFSVERQLADQLLIVRLSLRANRGRLTQAKRSTAEILESRLVFKLENTWPRL
jgi:hypothetical protein